MEIDLGAVVVKIWLPRPFGCREGKEANREPYKQKMASSIAIYTKRYDRAYMEVIHGRKWPIPRAEVKNYPPEAGNISRYPDERSIVYCSFPGHRRA